MFGVLLWLSFGAARPGDLLERLLREARALEHDGHDELLIQASTTGWLEQVENELAEGANVDATDDTGRSALHWASFNGMDVIVEVLIAEGATVDLRDNNDWTALHMAASQGHEQVAEILLDEGAEKDATNNEGDTPLHLASMEGKLQLVQDLIHADVEVYALNNLAQTALDVAGTDEVENALRAEGLGAPLPDLPEAEAEAEADLPDPVPERNVYDALARLLEERSFARGERALTERERELAEACKSGDMAVVNRLIALAGVNVNAKDDDGYTALHWAAMNRHEDAAQALVNRGANVNAKSNDGDTPLHVAALEGDLAIVRLLASKRETDLLAANHDGMTAMDLAETEEVLAFILAQLNERPPGQNRWSNILATVVRFLRRDD